MIDTSVLEPELGHRLEVGIVEQLEPVFEQARFRLVDTHAFSERAMRIRVISFDSDQRDYEIELEMTSGDNQSTLPLISCDACNEHRFITTVVKSTPLLIELYEQNSASLGRAQTPHEGPQATDDGPVVAAPRALGVLGISGAVALGTGVSSLAAGTYFLARGRGVAGHPAWADPRPAAASAFVIGLLVASVGTTLLVLDAKYRHRERRKFALQVTPTYLGLELRQQF